MHEYDVALKSLFRRASESLLALTDTEITRWHNVELPEIRNLRVDLLGESEAGRLIQIELQSGNDSDMALRMLEYSAAVRRQFGRFAEQVVLYVGEAPLRMTGALTGPGLSFECRIVDIRELDGERLLLEEHAQVMATESRLDGWLYPILRAASGGPCASERPAGGQYHCDPGAGPRPARGREEGSEQYCGGGPLGAGESADGISDTGPAQTAGRGD